MNSHLHFDYTTVGHVTVDVLEDGSCRAGGTAFYSALQAARLGLRALIVTRGRVREVERLIEPHRDELALQIMPSPHTTTLRTAGSGAGRSQRLLAWAGPIAAEDLVLDTTILHVAPVARETPGSWRGSPAFVGLTPQGLARDWRAPGAEIAQVAPARAFAAIARTCDALVLSESERASCAALIDAASAAGAVVAVTAGAAPNTILARGHGEPETLELNVPALEDPVDDLGAGDVFAAAFFIALSGGRPPLEAAGFANAAAAVRMRGQGAAAIGSRAAIDARLLAVAGDVG